MARMNIYVKDDLKERMEAEEKTVNWSKVASRAFKNELRKIAKRKEKEMKEMAEREALVKYGEKLMANLKLLQTVSEDAGAMTEEEKAEAFEELSKFFDESEIDSL
jgi:post-segregation antitoxin (ccd killing protein)